MLNAYGNPKVAAKYEVEIGKIMVEDAKRAGHKPYWPSYQASNSECYNDRVKEYPFDAAVMAALQKGGTWRTRDLMQETGYERTSVHSVMRRFVKNGIAGCVQSSSHGPMLYFLVRGAGDCKAVAQVRASVPSDNPH